MSKGGDVRVGVFSKVPLFPPYGGNRARIRKLCTALRSLGCEVWFYLLPSRQSRNCNYERHRQFFGPDRFFVVGGPVHERFAEDAYKFYRRAVVYVTEALQRHPALIGNVDYLYPDYIDRDLSRIAAEKSFDIVIAEYVHFSRLLDRFPSETYKILDTHDSFQTEFTTQAETKGFLRADCVLAIQEQEAGLFRSQMGRDADRVRVVSHIVDIEPPIPLEECRGATFLGSEFEANVMSVNFFIREILPLVLARIPDFKLFVAGGVSQAADHHPSVVKLGEVPNIADAFRHAPILVNSIVAGTGVKIKLLEAFGMGVPSVSTQTGAAGIPDEFLGGAKIVADDDAQGFADEIVSLATDVQHRRRLGAAALDAGRRWNAAQMSSLQNLLEEVKSRKAPGPRQAIAS